MSELRGFLNDSDYAFQREHNLSLHASYESISLRLRYARTESGVNSCYVGGGLGRVADGSNSHAVLCADATSSNLNVSCASVAGGALPYRTQFPRLLHLSYRSFHHRIQTITRDSSHSQTSLGRHHSVSTPLNIGGKRSFVCLPLAAVFQCAQRCLLS